MPKYETSFDIVLSVAYDFEAKDEDEAREIIEKVYAIDAIKRNFDNLEVTYEDTDYTSIRIKEV